MANMLDKYRDAVDGMAVPSAESTGKSKKQRVLKKKELRAIKSLAKALRKMNKLDAERRKLEEDAAERAAVMRADTRKDSNEKKNFLSKLGDAVCKAVPKILTTLATLATLALGLFLQGKVPQEGPASGLKAEMTQMIQATIRSSHPEWCFSNGSGVPVSTFIPTVVSLVKEIGSTSEREVVKVRLNFKNGDSTEVSVPLSDLDQVDWFTKDHRCIVNSKYRQAKRCIADTIRAGISNVPTEMKYILDRTGIYRLKDTVIFAAGDRVITRSSALEADSVFELGRLPFHLDIDENLSPGEAIDGMLELMGISPEIGPVTRFNSTKRFIEDTLYEYSECTAVIDDLHTAESKCIRRRNEDTAEEIIRRIADDTGRGRMDGKTQVQRQFRGNAVFIGEYTIGKASTIPRALVVNLTKPPNGAILDQYQRQRPLVVSTFYYYFIQWYVDHFDDIRSEIDKRLTHLREATANSTMHGRLRDTQFYLQISYMVFLEFCKDSGFCSVEDGLDTYQAFSIQLNELVQAQQTRFKESVDVIKKIDYLALIRDLYKQRRFRVAKELKDFDPDSHDGLIHYNDCLCLRGDRLKKILRSIHSNLDLDDCVRALLTKNALKLVEDKYTVQIYGTGGKRFYAIKLNKLK